VRSCRLNIALLEHVFQIPIAVIARQVGEEKALYLKKAHNIRGAFRVLKNHIKETK
jgi:hypothetical protein